MSYEEYKILIYIDSTYLCTSYGYFSYLDRVLLHYLSNKKCVPMDIQFIMNIFVKKKQS